MDEIRKILFEGTNAQKRYLFSFDLDSSEDEIYKKFQLYSRYCFPKLFKSKDAPFHEEMVKRMIRLYVGNEPDGEFLNIAFRGASKTTYRKAFRAFVINCDIAHRRKYFKLLTANEKNGKQFITGVYNMLISRRVAPIFPETFEKSEKKNEETMSSFSTSFGLKAQTVTINVDQRGNVQGDEESIRPDELDFDDIESRNSLKSAPKTKQIWDNMQEALDGMSDDGVAYYSANYISERGNVHRLVERIQNKMIIPIMDKKGNPTWPEKYDKEKIRKIKIKADNFEGEYMCKPSASKDVFIDRESVDRQVARPPIKEIAGFKIFKTYNPSHRYAGGADVAGGNGLDSSASVFIDFDTIPAQVVGTYYNNLIKPDSFGHELVKEGNMFGECLLAPENNKFDECVGIVKLNYPMSKIYATNKDEKKITFSSPTTFGWSTNSLTKSKMFNGLAKAIEEGLLDLNDEDLIREARSYTRDDVMDAEEDPRLVTRHFDLLTACAIAWQMKDFAKRGSQPQRVDPITRLINSSGSPSANVNESYE